MLVSLQSIIMIHECFWVVLNKSINVAAIATGHHCSGDIEKETRRSYDRKFVILQGSARPEVRSELYEELKARI